MALYREHGIVLRTYKLGEADRIIVLLTRGRGKVRAVAKGVRKTKSKFGARLEPTSHIALQLYEGRELDIVTQAESVDHFPELRDDLVRLSRATTMLEVVDQIAQEGEVDVTLYQMLLGGLRAVAGGAGPVTVPAFFWKLLAHEGYRPVLDECVACGSTDDLVAFDATEGGVLCATCRRGLPISEDALALVRRILGGQLASVLDEPESPTVREVANLATHAMEAHLERHLKSLTVLDT